MKLEVGTTQQTMEVTATVPLINSENASIGSTITTKEVEDLPSNGGTPMMLAQFAMGVTPMSQPSQVLPFASGGAAVVEHRRLANQTNELLIDGVAERHLGRPPGLQPAAGRGAGSAREGLR